MGAKTLMIKSTQIQMQMCSSHLQPKIGRRNISVLLIRALLVTWTVSCKVFIWHPNSDSLFTPGSITRSYMVIKTTASLINFKNSLQAFSFPEEIMLTLRVSLKVLDGKELWVLSNMMCKSFAESFLMPSNRALRLLANNPILLMISILAKWPVMSSAKNAGTSPSIYRTLWIFLYPSRTNSARECSIRL